jgi:peptidoglycan/LPS O-acetylase OafA/YrhL
MDEAARRGVLEKIPLHCLGRPEDIAEAVLFLTLLATASYYLLESPFLRWKLRFTRVNSRPGG